MAILKWTICQWLPPIILATQEAEIRRIIVRSQNWVNSLWGPILKKQKKSLKKDGGVAQAVA
jgi:hypothetical protein